MLVSYRRFMLLLSFLSIGVIAAGCSSKSDVAPPPVKNEVTSTNVEFAVIADNEGPSVVAQLAGKATPAEKEQSSLFMMEVNEYGKGAAYIAKVGDQFRVVYNGKPGKLYGGIQSNSLLISPDGKHLVYAMKSGDKRYVVFDGKEIGPYDEVCPPVFSPDSLHLAYEARQGEKWQIYSDGLMNEPAISYYNKPVFSADSSRLLLIQNTADEQKKKMLVCNLQFKELAELASVAVPPAISADKTTIAAVVESADKKKVVTFKFNQPDKKTEGTVYDSVSQLVLSEDGASLAYVATKGKDSFLVLDGKEEKLPAGVYPWPPVIRPGKGAGIVVADNGSAYVYQAFYNDGIKAQRFKEAAELTFSPDGKSQAHGAIKNEKFLAVINGVEGPLFDRVVVPRFSPDGRFVVYRARSGNLRFVVVADSKGKILRQHQGYERVFDPVFTADGKSVAYGVKDGKKLLWKVEKL